MTVVSAPAPVQNRASHRTELLRAAVSPTSLGFGAAAIGNLYSPVTEDGAAAAVDEALRRGIRYFDTAPFYGYGLSEERLGRALASASVPDVVVSTKVGRLIGDAHGDEAAGRGEGFAVAGRRADFDYSRDGILRSFESSLDRLRRTQVDILLLHDIGSLTHGRRHPQILDQSLREALPAMAQLKEAGACKAIGIGVNEVAACLEVMGRFDIDCILLAGRYTILDHLALTTLIPSAVERSVSLIVGGPFNSGLTADAAAPGATFDYRPVDAAMLHRARQLYRVCGASEVDVGAAALQFVLAQPAVVSVVAGMRSPAEVASAVMRLDAQIPATLWPALQEVGLVAKGAPTPC